MPSKVICVGRNYCAHVRELGNEIPEEIVFFLKPNSAVADRLLAYHQEQLHYEGELCFIYEKGHFSAVGFGIDLTKRKLQSSLKEKGLPWERAKAFDGSAVFSNFIEMSEVSDAISFILKINGVVVQEGNIDLMIYKPVEILSEIQKFMSLHDGDILMTGTPGGVGRINEGDLFTVTVKDGAQIIIEDSWVAS